MIRDSGDEREKPIAGAGLQGVESIDRDEVHVWVARLDRVAARLDRLLPALGTDEKDRASRFRSDQLRTRFLASRAAQRFILARYAAVSPEDIGYEQSAHGKPSLRIGHDRRVDVRFNVTNSQDLALIAVAREREVGIDVEAERSIRDAFALARRFFSPAEFAALQQIPGEAMQRAFLACWTRKEAYVKAIGLGISMQLSGFDVNVDPDHPATLLSTRPDPADASRWTMHSLDPGEGYFATLVVEGVPAAVRTFEWIPPAP
jgi:4'-phosphopantetheinyl transferase